MALVEYPLDSNPWKVIGSDTVKRNFYPIQHGRGEPIKLNMISPQEGVVRRAKAKLNQKIKRKATLKRLQSLKRPLQQKTSKQRKSGSSKTRKKGGKKHKTKGTVKKAKRKKKRKN